MTKLFLLLLLPFASACLPLAGTVPPEEIKEPDQAMLLFTDGIDHFDSAQRNEAFARLEQQYPNSSWARRAKIISGLAGSRRVLEKQLKRQQEVIKKQEADRLALIDLKQQNKLLQEQVDVLKSLIVDLELRQP